jgi:hypothetical protein
MGGIVCLRYIILTNVKNPIGRGTLKCSPGTP